jgi:hypothetical protein
MPPCDAFDSYILPSGNEGEWPVPLLMSLANLSAITKVDAGGSGHLRFEEARDALTRRYEDTMEQIVFYKDGYGEYKDGIDADDVEIIIESMRRRTEANRPIATALEVARTGTTGFTGG